MLRVGADNFSRVSQATGLSNIFCDIGNHVEDLSSIHNLSARNVKDSQLDKLM